MDICDPKQQHLNVTDVPGIFRNTIVNITVSHRFASIVSQANAFNSTTVLSYVYGFSTLDFTP